MTFEALPGVVNDETLYAKHFRHMIQAVVGAPVGAFAGGVGAIGPAHGVCGSTDMKVTQAASPGMKVRIAAGLALITGTVSAEQGPYSVLNDAAYEINLSAADGSNPRLDLIIAQVRDDDYGGSTNDARPFVVTGTPAGSPSDPSLSSYPNALVLARVTVAAGATSITNANITDLRTPAGGWFRARGYQTSKSIASNQLVITTTGDVTSSSFSLPVIANRRYRVEVTAFNVQTVAAGNFSLLMNYNGTDVKYIAADTFDSGDQRVVTGWYEFTAPGTGSVTLKLRVGASGGNANLYNATIPTEITVHDIGAVLA